MNVSYRAKVSIRGAIGKRNGGIWISITVLKDGTVIIVDGRDSLIRRNAVAMTYAYSKATEIQVSYAVCIKCGLIWLMQPYIRNGGEYDYPLPILNKKRPEQRAICPRCTLKVLEERFGRLG